MTAPDGHSGRAGGGQDLPGAHPKPRESQADPSGEGVDPPAEAEDRGATLMLQWKGGDEAAFGQIVHLYSPRVFALITRFLGRANPSAEDLVQEVFMRVLGAKDRYEPTARFSTWLYSITWRLCANHSERQSHRSAASLDGEPTEGAQLQIVDEGVLDPSVSMEHSDLVRAVRTAIASLPENQRIAVVLARYHDMSYAEIATVIESTEKAVKSLIHRARATLREILQPAMEEEVA